MKKYNLLIILLLFSLNSNSQTFNDVDISTFNQGNNNGKYFKDINNNFQNFLGTWQGTISGNTTFKINLFKIPQMDFTSLQSPSYYKDIIGGSFQIIKYINTPNEIVLHNSIKYYPQNNITTNNVMYFSTTNGVIGGGSMEDNCANNGTATFTVSKVTMEILNIGNAPLQMHWTAKRKMMFDTWHLSIPKDIILTKI